MEGRSPCEKTPRVRSPSRFCQNQRQRASVPGLHVVLHIWPIPHEKVECRTHTCVRTVVCSHRGICTQLGTDDHSELLSQTMVPFPSANLYSGSHS